MDWHATLGPAGTLLLHGDVRRQSTVYFSPFNDAVQRQLPYTLFDASAEFSRPGARWALQVYARNLTNAAYITGTFSSPPPAIGGRPGDPRRYGIQVSVGR